ncbi:MAG: hypothetical protein A2Z24_02900 [Candidatus Woykebacteria bacterium RBG_16_44_10]|uniref:Prepilin-type N-terminal cleavage/methylation domain-containing protein n=1 Tax=Candidatus Woykebacteria bacterium RBG_16_44_10 TaxID=1802597 RepID=A0A1G1WCJ8_9BACT|nr:MAG: hypothetical protein A2Z24_02900 [Candidatus Woykebacteria bacterium RBG_16_44_10]
MQSSKFKVQNYLKTDSKGFTLIEMLVYAALLAIVSMVLVSFFIQVVNVTETSRRARESLDNARRSLDVIGQEIKHGVNVYTPTSTLGSSPGQLSLETTRDKPVGETSTYVDFYLDAGGIYLKREGPGAQLVTSEKVRVTNLVFTLLNSTTGTPAVRVELTAVYKDPISGPSNAVTLVSTTSLRSY